MEEIATLSGLHDAINEAEEPIDVAIVASAKMQQCIENAFQNYSNALYYKSKSKELYEKYLLSSWKNYVLSYQFAEASVFYIGLDKNVKGNLIFAFYAELFKKIGDYKSAEQALVYLEGGKQELKELNERLAQLSEKRDKELNAAESVALDGLENLDGFFNSIGNGLKKIGHGIVTAVKYVYKAHRWWWCSVDDSKYGRMFHQKCGQTVAEYYSKNKEVGKLAGQGVGVLHQKTRQYICPPGKSNKETGEVNDGDVKSIMVLKNIEQCFINIDKHQKKIFGVGSKKPYEIWKSQLMLGKKLFQPKKATSSVFPLLVIGVGAVAVWKMVK